MTRLIDPEPQKELSKQTVEPRKALELAIHMELALQNLLHIISLSLKTGGFCEKNLRKGSAHLLEICAHAHAHTQHKHTHKHIHTTQIHRYTRKIKNTDHLHFALTTNLLSITKTDETIQL